jgi:hypothetical protein
LDRLAPHWSHQRSSFKKLGERPRPCLLDDLHQQVFHRNISRAAAVKARCTICRNPIRDNLCDLVDRKNVRLIRIDTGGFDAQTRKLQFSAQSSNSKGTPSFKVGVTLAKRQQHPDVPEFLHGDSEQLLRIALSNSHANVPSPRYVRVSAVDDRSDTWFLNS